MRLLILAGFSVVSLLAQRAETHYFRAILLPSNEVPAVEIEASGSALIVTHVEKDAAGEVTAGSVEFVVNYAMPGATTFTGLHIHRGAAGANGPVVIDTGVGGANGPVVDETGRGTIQRSAQVRSSSETALAALRDLLRDPGAFYLNLHTTINPGGVMRGQIMRPEMTTLMTVLSPRNEVPAIPDLDAGGIAAIHAMRTVNSAGQLTSGLVVFEASYRFPAATGLTGFHIHTAPAGVNGPVTVNTGLANAQTPESGSGSLYYPVEIPLTNQNAVNTLNGLFRDPSGYYVNLHTPANPGGAIRGQLRRADRNVYHVTMSAANETPPVAIAATAPTEIVIHTIRGEDGAVTAGRFQFDVNYRFPGPAEFTGLHIHDGEAGVNGPVRLNTGLALADGVATETGFGFISRYGLANDAPALATLNSLMTTPQKHYINLHTRANPGGAVRAQVGAAADAPAVSSVLSAIIDPGQLNAAPGSLVSIFGIRLATADGSVDSGEATQLPTSLNGTSVSIGGQAAPLLMVSPGQVNAVVPFETPLGSRPVVVRTSGGESSPVNLTVQRYAPAIWLFGETGGQIVRSGDFNFVTAETPARPGETIYLWCTGLGQTSPVSGTGEWIPETPVRNVDGVTATIGGANAAVSSVIASAGMPGVYIVTIQTPPNAASGVHPLQLQAGGNASNVVMLPVQ